MFHGAPRFESIATELKLHPILRALHDLGWFQICLSSAEAVPVQHSKDDY
jgi:hypothetical protein